MFLFYIKNFVDIAVLSSTLLFSKGINRSGRRTPNVDPEAEAEAAATMCMMGGTSSSDVKGTSAYS